MCGGQKALASVLGVKQQNVWNWIHRESSRVPPKYCLVIEQVTGGIVSRQRLRPDDWQDIWPDLQPAEHGRRAANKTT